MSKKDKKGTQIKIECTETIKGSKEVVLKNAKVEITTSDSTFDNIVEKAKELLVSAQVTVRKLGTSIEENEQSSYM